MTSVYVPADLRELVRQRAGECCEYCLLPERLTFSSHEIDHVIARKHGGDTVADNLALSCILCNKHKGSDLTSIDPAGGQIVRLYNPRSDHWAEHFHFEDDEIVPRSAIGRVTVRLLQLNTFERCLERSLLVRRGLFGFPPPSPRD